MRAQRSFVPVVLMVLGISFAVPTELQANPLLLKVGKWCLGEIVSYGVGKAIDFATGQDFSQQIEREIPRIVARIATAVGPQRAALEEELALHRGQLAVLKGLTGAQTKELQGLTVENVNLKAQIAKIKADQETLLQRTLALESRMAKLERRVDALDSYVSELDARVRKLEEALIRECLDLRSAQLLGAEGFRVKDSMGGWTKDRFESSHLVLDARLLLNSCTGDLTQRGLLIQLSLTTFELDQDMSLYATFKGIGSGYRMNVLSRREIPLLRPVSRVDGQVAELFFPYGEIPDFSLPDRISLSLVLTHDGEVLYSLPDRVLHCVPGSRINCRWVQ